MSCVVYVVAGFIIGAAIGAASVVFFVKLWLKKLQREMFQGFTGEL